MMPVLNTLLHGQWRYVETWPEMADLIAGLMETLRSEGDLSIDGRTYWDPGETAQLMFSGTRHDNSTEPPNNCLVVSVNRSTGFGGLIWFVTPRYPRRGGVFEAVWVSNNPSPPDFDPRVVADPGEPRFHSRKSALPLPDVRQAIEEFCRTGTGERPECIDWAPSYLNGQRLDDLSDLVDDPEHAE